MYDKNIRLGYMRRKRGRKHRIHTKEEIWCCICKTASVMSNSDVEELICGDCYGRMIYWEELELEKERVNYVQGWNLKKKYKAPDGKIYSFGQEIVGEEDVRNTKQPSKKTKPVSKRGTKTSKLLLSKKDKTSSKKKRKQS